MVHVSGDGVEVLKGGESTGDSHRQPQTAQRMNPNLNDRPIRDKPEKVSGLQKKPAFVKQNLDRNVHKNINRNLNLQHHKAIDQHTIQGHTLQRGTQKPNLGRSRPTSGDYSGLNKMAGDYTVNKNPSRTFTQQPKKATQLHEPGVAKQPNRNLNEHHNQDYMG